MNALVLAAGLGTRLGPYTAHRPKALVEVSGRTMLELQLTNLRRAGFNRVAVNIHHFADMVIDYLSANGNFGMDILVSDESGHLLDTGGGIRQAFHLFGDDAPLLVHNVDIFSTTDLRALYEGHIASGADATLLTADRQTSRHLHFNDSMRLCGWSDDRSGVILSPFPDFDPSLCRPLAFQGIHVLSRNLLSVLDSVAEQSFSITGFYVDNADRLDLRAVTCNASDWVDAGKPDTLEKAAKIVHLHYE
ncbi:MAG: NTP transferase domain-containing protein [Bacteroidaceae bacterium]|nr:NTP transferase domain-containing protein [Bacteroidaceae bacterium]